MTTATCSYLSLSQAARRIPPTKGNRPVHTSTLTRWITRGVRTADDIVVKLEARRFPGGWKVTEEALERFLDRLTAAAMGDDTQSAPIAIQTSARRQRELAKVDAELVAAGF